MRGNITTTNAEYNKATALYDWYQSAFGQQVHQAVSQEVKALLKKIPLNSVLYMNSTPYAEVVSKLKIPQVYKIGEGELVQTPSTDGNAYLPMASKCVDCMLLMHELDISDNPHHLLREAERVLTDAGYLIIVGFNRFSLYGLLKAVTARFEKRVNRCKFYNTNQIRDWLNLLNFEVEESVTVSYFFPANHPVFQTKLKFCRSLMARSGSSFGNLYVLMAKKRTVPITPVVFKWKQRVNLSSTQLNPSSFATEKRIKSL